MEECIPCCPCGDEKDKDEREVTWFWYLMGSELMIFTLHVSAIIFGVVKVRRNACLICLLSKPEMPMANSGHGSIFTAQCNYMSSVCDVGGL